MGTPDFLMVCASKLAYYTGENMKLTATVLSTALLTGCATEMIGQCAMKSVSNDPLYGVGCGLAMTASALEGSAMLLNEVIQKTKGPSTPTADEAVIPQPAVGNDPH
jgi:hypothetical protein